LVQVNVVNYQDGSYGVDFVPDKPGPYTVQYAMDGQPTK
jgi:hypothetical protein